MKKLGSGIKKELPPLGSAHSKACNKAYNDIVREVGIDLKLTVGRDGEEVLVREHHSRWGVEMDKAPDQTFNLGSGGIPLDHPDAVGGIVP